MAMPPSTSQRASCSRATIFSGRGWAAADLSGTRKTRKGAAGRRSGNYRRWPGGARRPCRQARSGMLDAVVQDDAAVGFLDQALELKILHDPADHLARGADHL